MWCRILCWTCSRIKDLPARSLQKVELNHSTSQNEAGSSSRVWRNKHPRCWGCNCLLSLEGHDMSRDVTNKSSATSGALEEAQTGLESCTHIIYQPIRSGRDLSIQTRRSLRGGAVKLFHVSIVSSGSVACVTPNRTSPAHTASSCISI